MRMFGALRFPTFVKLPDTSLELLLLFREISFIGDYKMLVGGAVPGKRLLVSKDWADEWPEYPAKQHPWQDHASGSDVKCGGTVRHHLCDLHFAPLALRGGLQLLDPLG